MSKKIEMAPFSTSEMVLNFIIYMLNGCWEGYFKLKKLFEHKSYKSRVERILEAKKRISQKAKEIRLEKEISKLTFQNQLLRDRIKRMEKRSKITIRKRPLLVLEDEYSDEDPIVISDCDFDKGEN
jgi:hypothetical protein